MQAQRNPSQRPDTASRGRVYRVMVENPHGLMATASGDYVQRASAFKRAHKMAAKYPGRTVNVWEYAGPGDSHIHNVQKAR